MRNFGDPVIRIVGFKPLSMLPIWASLKQSTFIYPSEEDVIGSTRVFSALHQKLLKDEKIGIVWFIARKNAAPVIAAMIPGAERLGEHGEQVLPPGMWLVPLPYADDIRRYPETTMVSSPDSLVDMMRTVIQQLQLPKGQYNPEKYPNPGACSTEPVVVFRFLLTGLKLSNGTTVYSRPWLSRKTCPRNQRIKPSPSINKSTK